MTTSRLVRTTGEPDIVLYGGPGSGKSTQAELLAAKMNAAHLNMGGLLRNFIKGRSEVAQLTKKIMFAGKLVPVKITNGLAEKFISELKPSHRVVIEGYPRDMAQVKFLDKLLTNHHRQIIFIYVKLPVTVAKQRLLKRAKIEHRADDANPKALNERIKIFNHQAKELLAHYRVGRRLLIINGDQTVKQVHQAIVKALKSC